MSSLYILDDSSLSEVSFPNSFSKPVTGLLFLLILSFIEQKFSFTKIQFIHDSFQESCLWCCIKKSLPYPRSFDFLGFFPRSFRVVCLTFRPKIYFEVIFVKV